jgi:hypothetical protein
MANNRTFRLAIGLFVIGPSLLMADGKAQTARNTQSGTISGTMPPSLRIPTGISFKIRLRHALNSGNATAGANWDGVLVDDLVSPQGRVYALAGTTVTGVVASVQPAADNLPGAISLRATSIDGVELHTDNKAGTGPENDRSGGSLQPEGGVNLRNSHAGTTGSSGGFATSAVTAQINLSANAVLIFNTTIP